MGKNLLTEGGPCNFLTTVQKSHQPPYLVKNERSLNSQKIYLLNEVPKQNHSSNTPRENYKAEAL